jgi:hypothetical protein
MTVAARPSAAGTQLLHSRLPASGRTLGRVVRVRDATSGRLVELRPQARASGVCVHTQPSKHPASATNLRLLLVADVLMRAVELTGGQVLIALAGIRPDEARDLLAAARRLAIQPPLAVVADGGPATRLGVPIDIHVVGPAAARNGMCRPALAVGPVTEDDNPHHDDPAVARYVLLSRRYAEPAELRLDTTAADRLRWLRSRVADWATSPSRPIPTRYREQAEAYFANDLDTPSVLALLGTIEADQGIEDGAKFETFVFLDRVLGLDLVRDVGR